MGSVAVVQRLNAQQHVGSSWTGDGPSALCIARQILNHWTTREAFFHPFYVVYHWEGASHDSVVKNLPANAGDAGDAVQSLGWEEGHGTPLQYSCLENPRTEEPGGLQSLGSQR